MHWLMRRTRQNHDEYISVLEGRIQVFLEGKEMQILRVGDEPAFIPRRHIHSFKGFVGEKVIVRETAVPPETWGKGKAL